MNYQAIPDEDCLDERHQKLRWDFGALVGERQSSRRAGSNPKRMLQVTAAQRQRGVFSLPICHFSTPFHYKTLLVQAVESASAYSFQSHPLWAFIHCNEIFGLSL